MVEESHSSHGNQEERETGRGQGQHTFFEGTHPPMKLPLPGSLFRV